MRFCKLVPLDTFSTLYEVSQENPPTRYPHQSAALTLKVNSPIY